MTDELINDPYDRAVANRAAGPGPEPETCDECGTELTWYDDGDPESGPGEPYLVCKRCMDEADGIGMEMTCYDCAREIGDGTAPLRKVVKLGPVVFPTDPTQSYVLDCGHTTI